MGRGHGTHDEVVHVLENRFHTDNRIWGIHGTEETK